MSSPLNIVSMRNKVSPEEWAARVDLAASYRLVADLMYEEVGADGELRPAHTEQRGRRLEAHRARRLAHDRDVFRDRRRDDRHQRWIHLRRPQIVLTPHHALRHARRTARVEKEEVVG